MAPSDVPGLRMPPGSVLWWLEAALVSTISRSGVTPGFVALNANPDLFTLIHQEARSFGCALTPGEYSFSFPLELLPGVQVEVDRVDSWNVLGGARDLVSGEFLCDEVQDEISFAVFLPPPDLPQHLHELYWVLRDDGFTPERAVRAARLLHAT